MTPPLMPLLLVLVTCLAVLWVAVFVARHHRDVPDAATPQLMARLDDVQPRTRERESEQLPRRTPRRPAGAPIDWDAKLRHLLESS